MLRRVLGLLAGLVLLAAGVGATVGFGRAGALVPLAQRCVALQAGNGRFVTATSATRYAASARRASGAAAFFVKPTGLRTVMLYDRGRRLLGRNGSSRLASGGPPSEWSAMRLLRAYRVRFASRCTPFPEAGLDARGRPFTGTRAGGHVFGFVDAHLHINANMRAGGLVISGEPFDRFGIPAALGQDAKVHGKDGGLDYTGNLLRDANPVGTHDTHGWPTFTGWPVYNTQTHQQTYYVWLQRAYMAGERLVVAQTAADAPLCRLEPRTFDSCDETRSITAQIRTLRALQDYVDAQAGGAGRGWFRIVETPAQARRVIAAGKLAVIIGIESSDVFGCSVSSGRTSCTQARIDRGIAAYKRLGVRAMFIAHWVNNAFGGSALEGGAKGIFINILNRVQTGSYFTVGSCPGAGQGEKVLTLPTSFLVSLTRFFPAARAIAEQGMPSYPSGLQCNSDGLTALGRYLVQRLIANHMLIEVDHLSERARDTVLGLAEQARYPLVSSHNGTGGEWTDAELRRLYRLGGFAAVTPDQGPALAAKINRMTSFRASGRFFGVGIGTDTGGFSSLPQPRADAKAHPLHYPFRSFDGRVTFTRERTGSRVFDLGSDGVAHYGLIADLLADTEGSSGGRLALASLFNSAEAYIEMWERAERHPT